IGSSIPGTLGRTSIGSNLANGGADFMAVSGPYTLSTTATMTKMSGYLRNTDNHSGDIRGVIYTDNAGSPGTFVAVTTAVTIPAGTEPGWIDFPFSVPPTLTAGKYWLGYWWGGGVGAPTSVYYDNGTGLYRTATYSGTGNPPSPFGSGTPNGAMFSLYARYSISSTAPANTAIPTISGSNYPTQTLTATNGTWTGSPTSFAYQWRRCDSTGANCVNISGASNQTYVQQAADAGKTIRVVVTATNAGGSTPAVSNQTPVVNGIPSNTALPTISGTTAQGRTLTATNGTWANNPTGFAYQWQRCDSSGANCTNISGATGQTYVLQAADVGGTVVVVVTASNPGGSGNATSAPTTLIRSVPTSDPGNPPTIGGQAFLGQTLTANTGTWVPAADTFTYQWRRCDSGGASCADISGATAQTYVTQAADVGNTRRVVITGTNSDGSGTATTAASAVISGAPAVDLQNPPTISGTPFTTQTLTASPGTWTGSPTFTYQWQRCPGTGPCNTPVSVGTGQTYVVQSADIGSTLQVRVTGTNPVGSSNATSARTSVIQTAPSAPPSGGDVIYDATVAPLPGNLPSVGAEAYAFKELGDEVTFA